MSDTAFFNEKREDEAVVQTMCEIASLDPEGETPFSDVIVCYYNKGTGLSARRIDREEFAKAFPGTVESTVGYVHAGNTDTANTGYTLTSNGDELNWTPSPDSPRLGWKQEVMTEGAKRLEKKHKNVWNALECIINSQSEINESLAEIHDQRILDMLAGSASSKVETVSKENKQLKEAVEQLQQQLQGLQARLFRMEPVLPPIPPQYYPNPHIPPTCHTHV